jgi:hypothetical protein
MTMRSVNRLGCWLAGAALTALSPSAASATIFPSVTIGGIYQQMTSTTSIAPPTEANCENVNVCYIVFSRVPNGKQLIVTNVSCFLAVAGAVGIISAALQPQLPNNSLVFRYQWLQPSKTHDDIEGRTVFAINNTTVAPMASGQRPLVVVQTSAPSVQILGTCTVAGQISDAP